VKCEQSARPKTITEESFMNKPIPKNTICLWYNKDAQDAARFYAAEHFLIPK